MRVTATIFCIILEFVCVTMRADNMRRISSREGISNNSVLSLAQGQDGYIWFGTCDGLDLWNGEKAISYPSKDYGMTPLSGNLIEEIISTKDSLFWVRTNYGLDLFGNNGIQERHQEFQGIYFAAARKSHETFIFAPGDELYGYQPSSGRFNKVQWPGGFSFHDILETGLSEENIVWIFCRNGIYYADATFPEDGSTAWMNSARKAAGSRPLTSAFRKDGGVYIIDHNCILSFFNIKNGQIDTLADIKDEINCYGTVSDIVRYGNGYMISYLYNGVTRLTKDAKDNTPDGYVRTHLDIDCGVFSLLRDKRQDIVWIGTDGQGVIMYAHNPTSFCSYTFDRIPYSLSKPVRTFLTDSKGTLWIGTKGEGILQIPEFTNGERITASGARLITTANSALADESVYALEESRTGVIWIGSEGNGLNYYSYRTGKIHRLEGKIPNSLRYVHGIHEQGNILWIATVGRGVYRLEIAEGKSGPYVTDSMMIDFGDEMLNKDMFFCVYEDSDGTLLFGNRGGGLAMYDPIKKATGVMRFDTGRSDIANDVWTICRSRKGDLWLGTSFGLLKVSLEDNSVEETAIKKSVHGILEGKSGELWISTNRGLVKYIPENDKSITYGYSYGVNTIEYSDGAYYTDLRDSLLFFGGTNGFVTVSSHQDTSRSLRPQIQIRGIKLSGQRILPARAYPWNEKLTVGPKERLYEIDVDALDYIDGDNYQFSYMLKGFDRTWNDTPKTIKLPDLAPGKYTLSVKYYNPVSGYASPISDLEIKIRPQWYASTLAKVLYVIFLLCILYSAAHIYRLRRKKMHQEQINRMEAQRKEEIMDSTVQLFENIAQELTMPVTMISGPCQQILEYDRSDSFIKLHSEKILQQSGKLLSMLRMFQDFKESNDNEQLQVQLFSVSDIAEDVANTFIRHAEARDVTFRKDIQKNLIWSSSSKKTATVIEMLLTNAFISVSKHGSVGFSVWSDENMLKISVSNSGETLNQEEVSSLLGQITAMEYPLNRNLSGLSFKNEMRLAVCNNIITRLNGKLSINSSNGNIKLMVELPSLNIPESDTAEPHADYRVYGMAHDKDRMNNADIYNEQLMHFDVIKERLLMYIVGSDPEIMNLIAELFASQYNIRMFNDCSAADEAFHINQPDIFICEYLIMREDILNLIKKIKGNKVTSGIPVILLSGDQHSENNVKAIESGADMHIGLPFDIKYLRVSVEQLLNKLKSLQDYYQSNVSFYQFTYGKILHKEDKEFIDKMLKIINENISDSSVTTSFIAEKMGVSVRTLYNKLDGLIDITPNNIIKEFRLMYAEQLLSTTQMSIDEIIYKSGYANRGTFFKNFSAKFGCTPKSYREKKNSGTYEG